jgi:hypothetical protein
MVGETIGILRPSQHDMPRALPEMTQPADFCGFYYDPTSNLLVYHAVMAAICKRSPQTLCEVPTLDNGLDAK